MLKTVWLNEKKDTAGCVLVLGGFDGVHVGHRRLISRAKTKGITVGITAIVGGKGDSLFSVDERLQIFKAQGADFAVVMNFVDVKDMTPSAFLNKLEERYAPSAYVCGDDFRFGRGASGDPELIKRVSSVPLTVEKLVSVDGQKVSTSTLKRLLQEGDVKGVEKLLGFSYFAVGIVEKGRQVGRTMGFPTANVAYAVGKTPLKEGVYAVRAQVQGKRYKGIANFGAQPTFAQAERKLEVYLDGFNSDLYGQELKVEFSYYLRPVTAFASAEALKEQLQKDIRKVREND